MAKNNAAQLPPAHTLHPIPQTEKKRLMQAEVNEELFEVVMAEAEKRGLKIRQVSEWGLRAFLLRTNPAEARRLGISNE